MFASRRIALPFLSVVVLILLSSLSFAADPGGLLDTAAGAVASDQKAGSLLFFNIYTSSTTNPAAHNTSLSITNTSTSQAAFVHLFFVDGSTCSVADRFICLTNLQTTTFYAADEDPGITGYIVALAVDFDGLPTRFNYLIGVESVKFATGHADTLGAEAYVKYTDTNVVSTDGALAGLFLDGLNLAGSYSPAGRVVAVDNIPSRASGNDTLLILNRIGGRLDTGAFTLGNIFVLLYDEAEQSYSSTLTGNCQLRVTLSDAIPRTTPRFTRVIPAGSVGWMKLFNQSDIGISGAVFNFNPNNATDSTAFNGGHNLHKLTLSRTATYTLPVFPPSC